MSEQSPWSSEEQLRLNPHKLSAEHLAAKGIEFFYDKQDRPRLTVEEIIRKNILLTSTPSSDVPKYTEDASSYHYGKKEEPKFPYDAGDFINSYRIGPQGKVSIADLENKSAIIDAIVQMETIYKSGVQLQEIQQLLRDHYRQDLNISPADRRLAQALFAYYSHISALEGKPAFSLTDE